MSFLSAAVSFIMVVHLAYLGFRCCSLQVVKADTISGLFLSSFSFTLFTKLDSSTEALKTLGAPVIILISSFQSL